METKEQNAPDLATCSICEEAYDCENKVPKSLDCRHTFCAPCITETCETKRECPKCGVYIVDPDNLPDDLTMLDYMKQMSQDDDSVENPKPDPRDYTTITKPKAVYGMKGYKLGEFDGPTGVTILPGGDILVIEYEGNRAQILTQQGEPVLYFGKRGKGEGQFRYPRRATVTTDGEIAICDQFNHRLQFFSMTGECLHTFGSKGTNLRQLYDPRDIAVDDEGNVYVVERNKETDHHRVQVFNKTFTTSRQFGEQHLNVPAGIAVHGDYVVVCDFETSKCELFQKDGQHLGTLCTPGSDPGQLKRPVAVAFDQHGNVIIAEWENQRIQIVKRTGEVVHVIKNWESNESFRPNGIAVTDTDDLIVCDGNSNCVYVF